MNILKSMLRLLRRVIRLIIFSPLKFLGRRIGHIVLVLVLICIGIVFFVDPDAGYISHRIDSLGDRLLGEKFAVNGEYSKGLLGGGLYLGAEDVVLPWPPGTQPPDGLIHADEMRAGISLVNLLTLRPWKYVMLEKRLENGQSLRIEGMVKTNSNKFSVKILEMSVAGNTLQGNISGTFDKTSQVGIKMDVTGELSAGRLNLATLPALKNTNEIFTDFRDKPREAEDTPEREINYQDIHKYNADFDLEVENLYLKGARLGRLSADLVLKDGLLSLNVPKEPMAGGTINGQIMADFKEAVPYTEVNFDLNGFDYAEVLKSTGYEAEIEGKLDAAINLRAESPEQETEDLYKRWVGNIRIVAGKGRIESKALDFWARDLATSILPLPKGEDSKVVDLNCAAMHMKVREGVGEIRDFLVDTEKVTIGGTGGYNFFDHKIDVVIKPRPKNPQLVNLASPVRIAGPITKPSVYPDPGGTVLKLGGLALTAVNPLALAIPVVKGITADRNPCLETLEKQQIRLEQQQDVKIDDTIPEKAE